MLIKYLSIPFYILALGALSACSSNQTDYISLMEEYESNIARINAENVISIAGSLHQENLPEVQVPNFLSKPVPSHYKGFHQSLGIAVDQIKYTELDWMNHIKQDDQLAANHKISNPQVDHGHRH